MKILSFWILGKCIETERPEVFDQLIEKSQFISYPTLTSGHSLNISQDGNFATLSPLYLETFKGTLYTKMNKRQKYLKAQTHAEILRVMFVGILNTINQIGCRLVKMKYWDQTFGSY